jgi:hypothetical protein
VTPSYNFPLNRGTDLLLVESVAGKEEPMKVISETLGGIS